MKDDYRKKYDAVAVLIIVVVLIALIAVLLIVSGILN
jgi:hypothetical protein